MRKINNTPYAKKFISIILSAVLLIQANMPAFSADNSISLISSAEALDAANKIDEAFLKGKEGNPYESALNAQKDAAIKKINGSQEKAKLASLRNTGKSKKGNLWPMYVEAAGKKQVQALEEKVKQALGGILTEPAAMPYKTFQKEYLKQLRTYADEYVRKNGYTAEPPFKTPLDKACADLQNAFPAKKAYKEYLKDAQAEIAWYKQNKAKVEEAAYQVARAGVKAIGAENLSFNFAAVLMGITLNGKKPITKNESEAMYNYHVTRLEKQQFDVFDFGFLSGEKQKKVASALLVNIIRSISIPSQLQSASSDARYPKAVENLIYRSQESAAFSQVLGSGFAALLANGHYTALDRILSRYTKMENDGSSWGDWLTLVHYVNLLNGDKYLGPASIRTQYNTGYVYANTFTDIAALLAENGSGQAKNLLNKYAFNPNINDVIKPFLKGALTAKKSPISAQTAEAKAAALANMDFGDITATYEYDIDFQLLSKHPKIAGKLTKHAITTKDRRQAKKSHQKGFGYLQRAAQAGDIYLMVYGVIGLAKLGKGAINLGKSTYTAIRASRIQNAAQRIAYIRANYGQMAKYISAKRSLMRLGTNVKIFFGKPVDIRTVYKLENAKNAKKLADMEKAAAQARTAAQESGKAKDIAKADYLQAQYGVEQARVNVGLELRQDGARSFLRKYYAYLNGETADIATLTSQEKGFLTSIDIFRNSMINASRAAADYYPHLNIFEKTFAYTYGKLSYWMHRLNPLYWKNSANGRFYTGNTSSQSFFTQSVVKTQNAGAPQHSTLSLTPKNPFGSESLPYGASGTPGLMKPSFYFKLNTDIFSLKPKIAIVAGSAILFSPLHSAAETKFFDPNLSALKIVSYDSPLLSNAYGTYDGQVIHLFKRQIEANQHMYFDVGGENMTVPQMISLIQTRHPESGITLERYNNDIEHLEKMAPQLTPAVFDRFLKSISNGELLKKIASAKSNKAVRKLPELFAKYNNSLNYFEAYRRAMYFPFETNLNLPRAFFHVQEFPAAEGFTIDAVEQSIERLNETEFAKRVVKGLFSSRNLINALNDVLSGANTSQSLEVSSKIVSLHYEVESLLKKGIAKKNIKGCIIDQGRTWDRSLDIASFNTERLGLSVEFQFDAGQEIVEWIHKNNIPLDYRNYVNVHKKGFLPQEVLDNIHSWAKSKLEITEEKPGHYVEFFTEDGTKEVHIYNNDYTARIRLGKHELSPGNPHIHFEYLEHGEWNGIRNHSYGFNVSDSYLPQINAVLQDLHKHFKPSEQMDLNAILGRTPPNDQKVLYVLGGPNASGKTRLFNRLFSNQDLPFLNQDIIAAENNISDLDAGRILLAQMDEMFRNGKSFIFESTLSGRATSFIKKAKENDYKVMILYIFVKDASTSITRAQSRVLEGGHGVPYGDLAQRYVKSRNNFWNLYKDMADDWIMFFNGDSDIVPIALKREGADIQILDNDIFSANQPLDPLTGNSIVTNPLK